MTHSIKDLRSSTGLTQKDFAAKYQIPLSTLRKWEQGESSPPPYVLSFLAHMLPSLNSSIKQFRGDKGHLFYYDATRQSIYDAHGNEIHITDDLENVNEQNLSLYLEDLFEGLYEIQGRFHRDCASDSKYDILWERF